MSTTRPLVLALALLTSLSFQGCPLTDCALEGARRGGEPLATEVLARHTLTLGRRGALFVVVSRDWEHTDRPRALVCDPRDAHPAWIPTDDLALDRSPAPTPGRPPRSGEDVVLLGNDVVDLCRVSLTGEPVSIARGSFPRMYTTVVRPRSSDLRVLGDDLLYAVLVPLAVVGDVIIAPVFVPLAFFLLWYDPPNYHT